MKTRKSCHFGQNLKRIGTLLGVLGLVCLFIGEAAAVNEIGVVPASALVGSPACIDPTYNFDECAAQAFETGPDLAYSGNGSALPAVANDNWPGFTTIHNNTFANDGLYGNGSSWISYNSNSWLKIDLGQAAWIDRLALGRDRLGYFDDRDPGRLAIAVALADDVYANGNSANDATEYVQVFDSATAGFSGFIAGPQTIQARFDPVQARFVKLTVANFGAAIDEVEIFAATAPPETQYQALVALYNSTNGPGWRNKWDITNTNYCGWYGVTCDTSGNVTQLNLIINQLNGFLPPELGNLSQLKVLYLSNNQLSGAIPPELGNLSQLQILFLWPGNDPAWCVPTQELLDRWSALSGNYQGPLSVCVVDLEPPVLSLPAPMTVEATSSAGAVAVFEVTATDNVDPAPAVSCTPPSGSTFPLGVTTVNCTAADTSGNSASGSFDVTVQDTIPPVITGSRSPEGNASGWNNTDVTVSFSCQDSGSGVELNTIAGAMVSAEGAGQSVTNSGTCTDRAGNVAASATVGGISIDKTPPTLEAVLSPAPTGYGWYNADVLIHFVCADPLSDIATCGPDVTLGTEGAGQAATGTAVDQAGNTASLPVEGIHIDKTPPTVWVTGVEDGATYLLGQVPAAGCTTEDSLSGVAEEAGMSLSGGQANGIGQITTTCAGASDRAGNPGSASVSYEVSYDFAGFFPPVDNPPVLNAVKAGSAVPIKFSLAGDWSLDILASGYPKSGEISCDASSESEVEETVDAGESRLTYDAGENQYNYVWKTNKDWAGKCRQFTLRLSDGREEVAYFKFK